MITLQLFSTAGCHLCESAEQLIYSLSSAKNIQLKIIEIGDDDQLVEQYGIRIPVIKFSDESELNWPFTQQDILQKITVADLEL
ncbi:glutaredoxin family protein [Methylophaga nitratireducenticrescens]|uniref:Glutaredoxin-like protein n=1 Tax=Methylophaga nitratireducenticrescens TaxID=754476 RepID=I1XHF7_METNJ|nr:glutaredoxin family protein [Methylophaga nitratireducenticrescens]AFI83826.1 thioredoxin family protein [Methylophaga nitratireducenticrescens]AUZ83945.1 thioredoxin family protein [Methylophaga nitratireducenticrescens]